MRRPGNCRAGIVCNGANTKVRLNDSTMQYNDECGLEAYDDADEEDEE